jgi:type V secretory pathway adhesin AidA
MFTEGVVNKVGVDHLGVLVLGVFNASIAIEATGGAFEYDAEVSAVTKVSHSVGAGCIVALQKCHTQ